MPRKPVRGRLYFKIPTSTSGSFTVESDKDKSIDAAQMVKCLRHYASFIERHFVKKRSRHEIAETVSKP
jgi:hypothetical protein